MTVEKKKEKAGRKTWYDAELLVTDSRKVGDTMYSYYGLIAMEKQGEGD